MNLTFETAYKQITPAERAFVDSFIGELETEAVRNGERMDIAIQSFQYEHEFLERSLVRAAISERVRDLTEQYELTAHKVLKEVRAVAFSNMGDYMEIDEFTGQPQFDLSKCTPEQLAAVQSIEIEENMKGGRKFKFRLHSKMDGIEKLMRYMGLLDADNPHWADEQTRIARAKATPIGVTRGEAANAYNRFING